MDNMLAWLPCEPSVSFRGMEEPKAYPISGSFASTSRWFDVGLTLADRAAADGRVLNAASSGPGRIHPLPTALLGVPRFLCATSPWKSSEDSIGTCSGGP